MTDDRRRRLGDPGRPPVFIPAQRRTTTEGPTTLRAPLLRRPPSPARPALVPVQPLVRRVRLSAAPCWLGSWLFRGLAALGRAFGHALTL